MMHEEGWDLEYIENKVFLKKHGDRGRDKKDMKEWVLAGKPCPCSSTAVCMPLDQMVLLLLQLRHSQLHQPLDSGTARVRMRPNGALASQSIKALTAALAARRRRH